MTSDRPLSNRSTVMGQGNPADGGIVRDGPSPDVEAEAAAHSEVTPKPMATASAQRSISSSGGVCVWWRTGSVPRPVEQGRLGWIHSFDGDGIILRVAGRAESAGAA